MSTSPWYSSSRIESWTIRAFEMRKGSSPSRLLCLILRIKWWHTVCSSPLLCLEYPHRWCLLLVSLTRCTNAVSRAAYSNLQLYSSHFHYILEFHQVEWTSWIWNLRYVIWEWRLTLPSFGLATHRQTTVYFRTTQTTRLRIGYGTRPPKLLQTYRMLAPCAVVLWKVKRAR